MEQRFRRATTRLGGKPHSSQTTNGADQYRRHASGSRLDRRRLAELRHLPRSRRRTTKNPSTRAARKTMRRRHPRIVVTTRPRVSVAVAARRRARTASAARSRRSADGPRERRAWSSITSMPATPATTARAIGPAIGKRPARATDASSGAVRVVTSGTCAYGNCLQLDAGSAQQHQRMARSQSRAVRRSRCCASTRGATAAIGRSRCPATAAGRGRR